MMMRMFLAVGILLGVVAALVAWRWKMRSIISPPTGSFAVGTVTLNLEDKAAVPPRTMGVQIWYPAVEGSGSMLHHWIHRWGGNAAVTKAAVADGRHPVLLFFPGWGARVRDNTSLLQDLASHGFAVAGVSYPEGKGLPDRHVPMQFTSDAAYAAGIAQGNRIVQVQAEDASFVLNHLQELDRADPMKLLTGHLDTGKAGALGYSLGGAVAAQAGLTDARFLAVMNLDGWMFGDVATQFFKQPYLVISDGLAQPTAEELASTDAFLRHFSGLRVSDRRQQNAQLAGAGGGYRVTIQGSDHFTFGDGALLMARKPGLIEPRLATTIVAAYAVQFFGKYLQGRPAPLLDGREALFTEAHLETFGAAR
jgi:pimeloyl-ACP methyl ester carboxylesterase